LTWGGFFFVGGKKKANYALSPLSPFWIVLCLLQPDITFFGEALPGAFHDRLLKHDRGRADLVIVIGTSLKVAPVSEIVGVFPPSVPQIYISRTVRFFSLLFLSLLLNFLLFLLSFCRFHFSFGFGFW
jgi:hypothetical protein